jgi:tRNA modification GTPase
METADTICAISTPPGEGGIGIIRISGPKAHGFLKQIFQPIRKQEEILNRTLYLGSIISRDNNEKIDEVFAVLFKAPKTYTREDMAEVYSHGGFATQQNILSLLIRNGVRLAEPGEFTKRAYLNGRIDLLQAESVIDIIQSETDDELRCAIDHLEGKLSREIHEIKEKVKGVLVEIEALIDFPEEEIDVDQEQCVASLRSSHKRTEKLLKSYYIGKAIRHGLEALIIGRTNVGKSSLLNCLLLKEKAIVTPLPGTTRDLIEDTIHIKGIKVKVVDTAGLRTPRDVVEKEGIDRVRQRIPGADLIIWVLDGSEVYSIEDEEIYTSVTGRNIVTVINKIDLPQKLDREKIASRGLEWLEISALKDTGMDELKDTIYRKLMGRRGKRSGVLVTSLRQKESLQKTYDAIGRAINCHKNTEPVEFMAFELREALLSLGEFTGETCSEEILHDIFSRFCIGK